MTISRAAIAIYLDDQFIDLASMIGQNDDPVIGYAPDINNALRQLGTAEDDLAAATVDDGQRSAVFTLAEYYAALRLWRRMSARANVKVDDSQFDYREVLKNAKLLVDEAQARCAALGYDVAASSWGMVDLNLDWAEPDPDYLYS